MPTDKRSSRTTAGPALGIRLCGLLAFEWTGKSDPGKQYGEMAVHFAPGCGAMRHQPYLLARLSSVVKGTPAPDRVFEIAEPVDRVQNPTVGTDPLVGWALTGCELAIVPAKPRNLSVTFGSATELKRPDKWDYINLIPDLGEAAGVAHPARVKPGTSAGSLVLTDGRLVGVTPQVPSDFAFTLLQGVDAKDPANQVPLNVGGETLSQFKFVQEAMYYFEPEFTPGAVYVSLKCGTPLLQFQANTVVTVCNLPVSGMPRVVDPILPAPVDHFGAFFDLLDWRRKPQMWLLDEVHIVGDPDHCIMALLC